MTTEVSRLAGMAVDDTADAGTGAGAGAGAAGATGTPSRGVGATGGADCANAGRVAAPSAETMQAAAVKRKMFMGGLLWE